MKVSKMNLNALRQVLEDVSLLESEAVTFSQLTKMDGWSLEGNEAVYNLDMGVVSVSTGGTLTIW